MTQKQSVCEFYVGITERLGRYGEALRWLLKRFGRTAKGPGAQALQDALGVLEAKACSRAKHSLAYGWPSWTKNISDLGNGAWEVVEVSPEGGAL